MSSISLRLVLAQCNLTVGDIRANTRCIIETIRQARDEYQPDLVIFPELAITSYPPEDLLLRPGLRRQVQDAVDTIRQASDGIGLLVGLPEYDNGPLYNSCFWINDQEIRARYRKQVLPNYGVFDEKRYFTAGTESCVLDFKGIPTAITICEDIWQPGPARQARDAGAELLININASPYHTDKFNQRQRVMGQRIDETGLNIVYLNLVGGQDELVFDGGSMMLDHTGTLRWSVPQFETGLYPLELRRTDPGHIEAVDPVVYSPAPAPAGVYQALILGIRDYVWKNGFKGAVIGLSGGIDSALTLALAVDALGADNVEVLCMPSRYTGAMSIEDSRTMAGMLNVHYHELSIEAPFMAILDVLQPILAGLPPDTTEENIQSRCRGLLLMAVSNKTGKMVIATGNKSEMAVGYATLYGDMAGGFAPLKDVSKTLVFKLANWRNSQSRVIPQRIIDRPPSAELKADQLDSDSLPAYDMLDAILERYIEHDEPPGEIIAAGFAPEIVNKVVRLVDRNEYKRRQAAPGVRISERAFGRDRRYPITSGYDEQAG